MDKNNALDI